MTPVCILCIMSSIMKRSIVTLLSVLGIVQVTVADEFTLVDASDAARIVIAESAVPTSRRAAEELAEYVFKASGKRPAVEVDLSAPATRDASGTVRIGTLERFPGKVPEEARTALAKCRQFEAGWTGASQYYDT